MGCLVRSLRSHYIFWRIDNQFELRLGHDSAYRSNKLAVYHYVEYMMVRSGLTYDQGFIPTAELEYMQ